MGLLGYKKTTVHQYTVKHLYYLNPLRLIEMKQDVFTDHEPHFFSHRL